MIETQGSHNYEFLAKFNASKMVRYKPGSSFVFSFLHQRFQISSSNILGFAKPETIC